MLLMNDRFVPKKEASVSYLDRGYVFGDGVYEVFRVYGGRMFEPEAHYRRLERNAAALKLRLPFPIAQLDAKLRELLLRESVRDGTVYVQITRGVAPRAHAFPRDAEPVLIAYCTEVARPLAAIRNGIKTVTAPDIRWLRCDIKTINLLPNVMAKQEALERGADDAIFHRDGVVTECTAANLMMVRGGVIYTHPANHLILHGVTRSVVLELARAVGVPVREQTFTLDELARADELFATGTTAEITPILEVDGRPVGDGRPGPVTRKLQDAFERRVGLE